MPHTVPNRPMKGDDRADGGQEAQLPFDAVGLAQDGDAHRLVDALLDAGQHGFRAGAPPSKARRHSRKRRDEHRRHGMIVAGGELLIKLVQRLARPEESSRTCRALRLRPDSAIHLLKMMVQDHSEASSRRIITAFTTIVGAQEHARRWRNCRRHRADAGQLLASTCAAAAAPAPGTGRAGAGGRGDRARSAAPARCAGEQRQRGKIAAKTRTDGSDALHDHGNTLLSRDRTREADANAHPNLGRNLAQANHFKCLFRSRKGARVSRTFLGMRRGLPVNVMMQASIRPSTSSFRRA